MNRRGSFLVGGALLVLLILFAAVFGVDLSLYFQRSGVIQQIADHAALTGGEALGQYTDDPVKARAYNAVLDYIESNQGVDYRDLYEVNGPENVTNIMVVRFDPADTSIHPYYRVGVVAFGQFEPYFLPKAIFGDNPHPIVKTAVAEVNADRVKQIRDVFIRCGVISGVNIVLNGNNLDARKAKLCANGNIDAGGPSANKYIGESFRLEGSDLDCPRLTGCGTPKTYPDERQVPDFALKDPALYDTVLNDTTYTALPSTGCAAGKQLPDQVWSNDPTMNVCVVQDDSNGDGILDYRFKKANGETPNNMGKITQSDGTSTSLYVDGQLVFDFNAGGLSGGVYTTEKITVNGNSVELFGDPELLGGLALWSEDVISIDTNGVHIKGIMGSKGGGDVYVDSSGGGTGTTFEGIIISQGSFNFQNNSQNADILYNAKAFNLGALSGIEFWLGPEHLEVDQPLFSNINVRLIE